MLQSERAAREGCVSVFPGRGRVGSWEGGPSALRLSRPGYAAELRCTP